MRMNLTSIAYVAAIVLAGFGVYFVMRGGQSVASSALASVNPANPNNLAAQAANKVAQVLTGDANTTAGSALYDFSVAIGINPDAGKIATAPSVPHGSGFPAPDFQSAGGEQGFII